MGRIVLIVFIAMWTFSFPSFATAPSAEELISKASNSLNVQIYYACSSEDTWSLVTYAEGVKEEILRRYVKILEQEYQQYPPGYLKLSGVDQIILVNDLKFNGQARAAVPDPQRRQLYLSVNGAYGISSRRYLTHVLHHELQHCTEYMLWSSMTHDWEQWQDLNVCEFAYGRGGAFAYAEYINKGTDFYSPAHPAPGFVNRYSMTGDEEDRAELLAFIMTRSERRYLLYYLPSDTILQNKVCMLKSMLTDFSGGAIKFPQ